MWWQRNADKLRRFANLKDVEFCATASQQLAVLAQRSMQLQCTLQDGEVWVSCGEQTVSILPVVLQGGS